MEKDIELENIDFKNEQENDLKIKRTDLDNPYKRNLSKDSYKNRHFDGKRTAKDEYSGDKVYYSSVGQDNTSGIRHYKTDKTANVDHIQPIAKIKKKYESDIESGALSKEQVKKMTNSDYNLAVTSESRNKIKNDKSNIEYLLEQAKSGNPENFNTSFNMIQKEVSSNIAMTVEAEGYKISNKINAKSPKSNKAKMRKIKAENFNSKTAHAMGAGTEAAFMAATVSTINNFVLVATNEKDIKQASKDIAMDVGESFASGAGLDLLQALTIEHAKKSNNEIIKNVLSKDLPIKEISAAIMIGNSVIRYINDDISAEECVTEIVLNGLGSIAYTMGMALGGPAGAIISTIVMGQISRIVIEYQNMNKLTKEKEQRISALKNRALTEMDNQRAYFKSIVELELGYWDETIQSGFDEMLSSACEETYNFQGITNGLDKILSVFDEEVRFKTTDEFKKQLKRPFLTLEY